MPAPATAARVALAALAAAVLAASASSKSNAPPPAAAGAWNAAPPPTQTMATSDAAGLWKTTFGAVKLEDDGAGGLHGAWVYQSGGKDVVGYFGGTLDGNVLRLTWREPAQAQPGESQLAGEGWLVFDAAGGRFSGRWWTNSRDRQGDWSGSRDQGAMAPPSELGGAGYGGASYGGVDYDGDGVPDAR